MERLSNIGSTGTTATVVRQFAPSRIEVQLLAQVFDLVCNQRWAFEKSTQEEPELNAWAPANKGSRHLSQGGM